MRKWPHYLFSLIFVIQNVFALQIKSVVDNETTTAKISATDVTRIFVQGDRIKSVKGLKGAYARENDEKNGEVYIQPTGYYQDRAFTILVSTEQGRHFTLLLNPTHSPSETLMLVPKGVGRERAARFEQASPYELTVYHLIRAMKNGEMPEGYAAHAVDNKTTYQLDRRFSLKLKTVYEGLNLRGEIYELCNRLNYSIQVDERAFYKAGTRAVSVDMITVSAKSTINLYRVVSHD
jgi:conjugal transfer pilus assembly protein TraK